MSAPIRNAASAQSAGMRQMGAMNMQKPVDIPSGGMMILRSVTAVRPSRTRQMKTTTAPKMDAMTARTGR